MPHHLRVLIPLLDHRNAIESHECVDDSWLLEVQDYFAELTL